MVSQVARYGTRNSTSAGEEQMRHLVSPGEEPNQRRRHTDQDNQSGGQVKDHPSFASSIQENA